MRTSPTIFGMPPLEIKDDGTNVVFIVNAIDQFGIRKSDYQILSKAGYDTDTTL